MTNFDLFSIFLNEKCSRRPFSNSSVRGLPARKAGQGLAHHELLTRNPMEARIDFATRDDLEAMAGLLAELFTLESDFEPRREKQIDGLRLILDDPEIGRLFVLRVDGRVAGMANALLTVSTAEGRRVALLEDVIVATGFRGRGFGRRLVEHVAAWAAANDLARITLLTDQDNAPALAFYERLGFERSTMRVLRRSLASSTQVSSST
jgi:ribosomal protein S18 acetylase RimI-like enzyme